MSMHFCLFLAPLSEFLVPYNVYTKQTAVFAVAIGVEANTSPICQSKHIASYHCGTGEKGTHSGGDGNKRTSLSEL